MNGAVYRGAEVGMCEFSCAPCGKTFVVHCGMSDTASCYQCKMWLSPHSFRAPRAFRATAGNRNREHCCSKCNGQGECPNRRPIAARVPFPEQEETPRDAEMLLSWVASDQHGEFTVSPEGNWRGPLPLPQQEETPNNAEIPSLWVACNRCGTITVTQEGEELTPNTEDYCVA